jgi:hypothetical protein
MELFRSIDRQTEDAHEFVLSIAGKHQKLVEIPTWVTSVGYSRKKSSQFLQLKQAWSHWRSTVDTVDDVWFTFSDADDLWENDRIKSIYQTINLLPKEADGFAMANHYEGKSRLEAEKKHREFQHSVEYWQMVVKASAVEKFFSLANNNLLSHPYADMAFTRWVIDQYKIAHVENQPNYFYRIHSDSILGQLSTNRWHESICLYDTVLFLRPHHPDIRRFILDMKEDLENTQQQLNDRKRIYSTSIFTPRQYDARHLIQEVETMLGVV